MSLLSRVEEITGAIPLSNFEMVREFMDAFQPDDVQDHTELPGPLDWSLRERLIQEEFDELQEAWLDDDIIEVADAIADLLYVVYGTAIRCGMDADALFAEVHRSNMSKLGEDGAPILRGDGKVLKGANFSEPDIEGVLREHHQR